MCLPDAGRALFRASDPLEPEPELDGVVSHQLSVGYLEGQPMLLATEASL